MAQEQDVIFRRIRHWEVPGGLMLADPPDEAQSIHDLCAFFWHILGIERHTIRREAHLTPREWDAWRYAMEGNSAPEYIALQMNLTTRQASTILRHAVVKVAKTPTVGVLTVYWEEVHRHGYRTPRQESFRLVK